MKNGRKTLFQYIVCDYANKLLNWTILNSGLGSEHCKQGGFIHEVFPKLNSKALFSISTFALHFQVTHFSFKMNSQGGQKAT